jgi:hypothetical protein
MKYWYLIAAGLVVAVLSITAASHADARQDGDLSGVYVCQGTLPNGRVYGGTVVLIRHQNTYQLLWTLTETEQYLGLGILHGDTLAVSVFGGGGGVVSYQVDRTAPGIRLKGQWTVVEADGRLFGESLTRVDDVPLATPLFKLDSAPHLRRRPASSWRPI